MNWAQTWYYEDGSIRFSWFYENWIWTKSYFDKDWNLIWTWTEVFTNEFNDKFWEFKSIINWLEITYHNNGQTYGISNYKNWEFNWIQTWYYENWQIASVCNYINWFKIWECKTYYENGQMREDSQYYGETISLLWELYELWNSKYYDELWNFIWSWEIKCLEKYDDSFEFYTNDDYNKLCSNLSIKWFFFTYYPSFKIKKIEYLENYNVDRYVSDKDDWYYTNYYENGDIQEKWNYNDWVFISYYDNWNIEEENTDLKRIIYFKNWNIAKEINFKISEKNPNKRKRDWKQVEYFENGQIYSEWNYKDDEKVWTWNRYLWNWSISVSKNYDE